MGRPSKTGTTIVVEIDGELLTWTDGLLSGTKKEYVDEAKLLSAIQLPVELTVFGPEVHADLTDVEHPEHALAAMFGVNVGRARLLQAPDSVLDILPFENEDEKEAYENGDDLVDHDF
jgi:hypothetical protein